MVIREILEIGRDKLKKLQYADPLKESIYLLSKVLEVDISFVYINLNKRVSKQEEDSFLSLIERRALGEPIGYIFNNKEFMGIDFFVEKGVLIPRPETENLVEYIIDYIRKESKETEIKVLDIGIGTGAISLSIAKNCKNTEVLGIDISKDALRVANKNLDRLKLKNVSFRESNLFKNIKENEKFSIIVSNPPYIKSSVIDKLQLDVKNFEPKLALDGGEDGNFFYREITSRAKDFLLDKGMLIYEIGFDQGEIVKALLLDKGFNDVRIIKDYQNLDRIVVGFKI